MRFISWKHEIENLASQNWHDRTEQGYTFSGTLIIVALIRASSQRIVSTDKAKLCAHLAPE